MEELVVEVVEEITTEDIHVVLIEIERHGGHHGKRHPHLVVVTIDTQARQVRPGRYRISALKHALGVDPTYELEQVREGKLVPFTEDGCINVKEGETFVSHVRGGASS